MILRTTDVGQVKVGDVLLPGIFESLEVDAAVKLDEVEIKGKKEKVTQAVEYDNARVRLNIVLLPEVDGGDCYDQIETLQSIFRKSPGQRKPGVYRIVNRHCHARSITQVVFNNLKTYEDNRGDKVLAICEFIEHVPIQVKVAKKKSGPAKPKPKPKQSKKEVFGPPGPPDKKSKTPAKDTRKPSLPRRIWNWLRGKDIA